MGELSSDDAGRLLAVGRLTVGTTGWLTPGLAARALGLAPDGAPPKGLSFVLRLFASRDIALGLGLLSSTGSERDRWLVLGMITDAGDAAAAVVAGLRRQMPRGHAAAATAAAVAAIALGMRAREN